MREAGGTSCLVGGPNSAPHLCTRTFCIGVHIRTSRAALMHSSCQCATHTARLKPLAARRILCAATQTRNTLQTSTHAPHSTYSTSTLWPARFFHSHTLDSHSFTAQSTQHSVSRRSVASYEFASHKSCENSLIIESSTCDNLLYSTSVCAYLLNAMYTYSKELLELEDS